MSVDQLFSSGVGVGWGGGEEVGGIAAVWVWVWGERWCLGQNTWLQMSGVLHCFSETVVLSFLV